MYTIVIDMRYIFCKWYINKFVRIWHDRNWLQRNVLSALFVAWPMIVEATTDWYELIWMLITSPAKIIQVYHRCRHKNYIDWHSWILNSRWNWDTAISIVYVIRINRNVTRRLYKNFMRCIYFVKLKYMNSVA